MSKAIQQILCICTGNICRSPVAEYLLRHALAAEEEPLRSIRVVSAGVAASDGSPASLNSVAALKKVGIDLNRFRSQPVTDRLIEESDLILCMTESHREILAHHYPEALNKLFLFREFHDPIDREVSDPYGMNLNAYESARDNIVESIPSIVRHLKQKS